MSNLRIVPATENDAPLILALIRELADYEKLLPEVTATEEVLRASLFGERRAAEVWLAYEDEAAVGYALFFHNFSTFLGRPGLYLEDLFVRPAWRGRGYGRALLARLAQIALERGCGRMEWSVLDWNAPAIEFYKRLGATSMDEWKTFRLTGAALSDLAAAKPQDND
jgi:GNAT superfamily N-acetyltransferase